jgi:hypothetical protein
MLTTPVGPKFVKNTDQSGAKSGDHTHLLGAIEDRERMRGGQGGRVRDPLPVDHRVAVTEKQIPFPTPSTRTPTDNQDESSR